MNATVIETFTSVAPSAKERQLASETVRRLATGKSKGAELHVQMDLELADVCAAMKRHRQSLKYPPKSVDEYLALLERQGLSATANRLHAYTHLL